MNQLKYRLAQFVSSAQVKNSKYGSKRRVLMYHSVGRDVSTASTEQNTYSLSERSFMHHVDLLSRLNQEDGSKVVPLTHDYGSGVTITFDDGYQDTLTIAAKILCEKNLPFTVFVSSANITSGDSKYLDPQQLIELSKLEGVTIGSHGHAHSHLAQLSEPEISEDLRHSKDWLEQAIQKNVTTLSYPHGSYNQDVLRIASEIGFEFAATSNWGVYEVGTRPLEIPRIDIWSHDSSRTLRQKLNGKWQWIARIV